MGNDTSLIVQKTNHNTGRENKEQLEMLLMTLEEVRHGICLFQSENQAERVLLIQKRLRQEKIIVHNIADDDKEKGMADSRDFRRWALESDANVVIVYNLQLLGMRFGDEEAVERLNFMRDQILAIGKLFVFGVSPYFNRLLSRSARDLYSCILHHFVFRDSAEKNVGVCAVDREKLSGDDALEIARYGDLKERIQRAPEKTDISVYLACMESWNKVREYLAWQEKEFLAVLAEKVEQQYTQKDVTIADVQNVWILAETWIYLEHGERSVSWYEKVLGLVRIKLGENHELYADALVEYADYYKLIFDFVACEKYYDQAMAVYHKKGLASSEKVRTVLQRKAILYRVQSKFAKALEIYQDLLQDQTDRYGELYFGNAYLHNNIGTVYEEQGEFSNALAEYKKALELLEHAGKQGGWLIVIYKNMCVTYLRNGDINEAWKSVKRAKRLVEKIYGEDSSQLIDIYGCMSGVWDARKRPSKSLTYLQKALDLIRRIHSEDSEMASGIYHNLGSVLLAAGQMNDAIAFCRRAIEIRERVYGEKNVLTANSYEQMAYILYKTSNGTEAQKSIEKARRIYVSLYGSQNEYVRRIDENLRSL